MMKLNTHYLPLATLLFFLLSSSGSFGSGFMSKGLFVSLHMNQVNGKTYYFCVKILPICGFLTQNTGFKCFTEKRQANATYYTTI